MGIIGDAIAALGLISQRSESRKAEYRSRLAGSISQAAEAWLGVQLAAANKDRFLSSAEHYKQGLIRHICEAKLDAECIRGLGYNERSWREKLSQTLSGLPEPIFSQRLAYNEIESQGATAATMLTPAAAGAAIGSVVPVIGTAVGWFAGLFAGGALRYVQIKEKSRVLTADLAIWVDKARSFLRNDLSKSI